MAAAAKAGKGRGKAKGSEAPSSSPNEMIDPRSETMEQQPLKSRLPSAAQWRLFLTLGMGVWIPLFSLALSYVGGNLMREGISNTNAIMIGLASFSFALMTCVLSVSLSHLAWAVEDITKSHRWASWALALAFDLALVLGELCHVSAEEAGVGKVVTVLMATVCVLSMFLNCWAFLKHPAAEERKKKKDAAKTV